MKLEAFDTLAGCTHGGYTLAEVAQDLYDILTEVGGATPYEAPIHCGADDNAEEWDDYVIELMMALEIYTPPFTSIDWEDGEVRVIPYVDDELPRFEEIPDDFEGDYCYTVTDHGNVTLWERVPYGVDVPGHVDVPYCEVWSMV